MPPFVINHGEKVVVVLVALICAYMVYATISDESTQPEKTSPQIQADFTVISEAVREPGTPNLRKAEPIQTHLLNRVAVADGMTAKRVMQFIHEIPSLGEKIDGPAKDDPCVVAYLIGQPELSLETAVGEFTLSIAPASLQVESATGRVKSGLGANWERKGNDAPVINDVKTVGYIVEMKLGQGEWGPLLETGSELGFLPVADRGTAAVSFKVSEWQSYELRARTVVQATLPIGPNPVPQAGAEVLVFPGELPFADSEGTWKRFDDEASIRQPLNQKLAPRPDEALHQTLGVESMNESLFMGDFADSVSAMAESNVRFVVTRVSPPTEDGVPSAQFMLTTEVDGKWIPLQRFRVQQGQMIGEKGFVFTPPNGGRAVRIDLSTPFRLVAVTLKTDRITHYEIENKPTGGDRALILDPRPDRSAKSVTLENTVTKDVVTLLTTASIRVGQPNAVRFNYPDYKPGVVNEEANFARNPASFVQPSATSPAPKLVANDHPKLREIFNDLPEQLLGPVVVCPDGRVFMIDALNVRLETVRQLPSLRFLKDFGVDPEPGSYVPEEEPVVEEVAPDQPADNP